MIMTESKIGIDKSVRQEVLIIKINGKLDINTVDDLAIFYKLNKEHFKKVAINFEQVSFVDSSGIGGVINILTDLRQRKGTLYCYGLPEKVLDVFRTAKLDTFLEIITTREFNRKFPIREDIEDLLDRY